VLLHYLVKCSNKTVHRHTGHARQSSCCNGRCPHSSVASPDLWPPNSRDLNSVNYKICGVMQDRVYQRKVKDVNELRERLVDVWAGLQQNVIDDAIDQWRRRLRPCVRARGGHFEYLSICCDCISYLGYGLGSLLKICWFIVKQDTWFILLLVFLFFNISQGSVGTLQRWGGIFINNFIANFQLSTSVKELWKSVNI